MDKYHTLYETSYGTVKAEFNELMSLEEAKQKGLEYCKEHGHKYHGTFNKSSINGAENQLRKQIYSS